MTEPSDPPGPRVPLDRLRAAYRACEVVITALPARAAYGAATALAELLRDLAERAAGLRARMAARVARDEGSTVRALARALGLSKSKAGELLARAAREEGAGGARREGGAREDGPGSEGGAGTVRGGS